MKPDLYFEEVNMRTSDLGPEATVPDLTGGLILQNNLTFHLEEGDEIHAGYGRRRNSFPYRQFLNYSRKLQTRKVKTAVLENDFLKAVFLPEFGGRLWSLWDKKADRNLLYTNDVLRFSNLAVRNAWFSGGVEWNIGVIGHSPFTTAPLFMAGLEDEEGNPVLRMYEYERIRGVVFQMDFWLLEEERFLNARMRIENETGATVPMYWWSNIAVPEHEDGRIIVPAQSAYTFKNGGVYKVDVPVVNGVDITRYHNIPTSVDYFFDIKKHDPKYIAHVDGQGFGLCQMSTARQQSRKLFSWGHKRAAGHWQEFLTDRAGRYLEIQAGLPKTQYGCLPMPEHTAWEWLERYGSIQLSQEELRLEFEPLQEKLTERVQNSGEWKEMEEILEKTAGMAQTRALIRLAGSVHGAVEDVRRKRLGNRGLSGHLAFGEIGEEEKRWLDFLETGIFPEQETDIPPDFYLTDDLFLDRLVSTMPENDDNWYAHYQLGILWFQKGEYQKARVELEASADRKENPWAYHGLAFTLYCLEEKEQAVEMMRYGLGMRTEDLSYVKDGFRLLLLCCGFSVLHEIYEGLPDALRHESRLVFDNILALYETGRIREAYDLLRADGGLVLDDVREGEVSMGELWKKMQEKLGCREEELPYLFDFTAV